MNRFSLLSDVPTPSIIFDISSLQKRKSIKTNNNNNYNNDDIPRIHLDKYNVTLVPIPMHHNHSNDDDDEHNNNQSSSSSKSVTKDSDKNNSESI